MEPYVPFRWVNIKPSVYFRKAHTEHSIIFRGTIQKCSARISTNLSARLTHLQTSSGKTFCLGAFVLGYSSGFPLAFALGESVREALLALEKTRPPLLVNSDFPIPPTQL